VPVSAESAAAPSTGSATAARAVRELAGLRALLGCEDLSDLQLQVDAGGEHRRLGFGNAGAQLFDLGAVGCLREYRDVERALQVDQTPRRALGTLRALLLHQRSQLFLLCVGQVELS
jgi:hypothetical protein